MKTIRSYLLSLLPLSGKKHGTAAIKHDDGIRKDNSCETSQRKERALEKPEPVYIVPKGGKEKGKIDYSETFLVQRRNINHKQTSVLLGEDIYYALRKILRIAGDGDLTMTGFVNNVLRHHFGEYKEEISELRRNYIADLTKEEEEEE